MATEILRIACLLRKDSFEISSTTKDYALGDHGV